MFDISLRRLKDGLAAPLCRLIPSFISPNDLTVFAFILGLGSCYVAAISPDNYYAVSLWLLNRLLDCLDGSLARVRGSGSELGGFLDLLCDFIIYSLIPISVGLGQAQMKIVDWRAVACLEASIHINNFVLFYIAAVASKRKANELTSVTMQPALIEGFEAGFLFTAMLLWPGWLSAMCWGMCAAVCLGTAQRVVALFPILRRLDESEPESKEGSRVRSKN